MSATETVTVHTVGPIDVRKLSMRQLHAVNDALSLAADVLLSVIQQPRFSVPEALVLNDAGEFIDNLLEHIYCIRNLVAEVAQASEPKDPLQAEMRAWLLLTRGTAYHDNLPSFAALAASLVAQQSDVEFCDRLGRRA